MMNSGELRVVDVPLAAAESDCESDAFQSSENILAAVSDDKSRRGAASAARKARSSRRRDVGGTAPAPLRHQPGMARVIDAAAGAESLTGSLEDLVTSFDEKVTMCFSDYKEEVEKIAPVQIRSQEEIMNECQVWWTITGNFGNMMPIDWSKSTTRAKTLPTLNLCAPRPPCGLASVGGGGLHQVPSGQPGGVCGNDLEEEDDIVAADLDMHSLILTSNPHDQAEPLKTADEVIAEIDDMIEDDEAVEEDEASEQHRAAAAAAAASAAAAATFPSLPRSRLILAQALQGRKLDDLGSNELTQIYCDLEMLVKELSEELVNDLGIRDELEYEKELKNTFISLLLSIQSKRRQIASQGGGGGGVGLAKLGGGSVGGGGGGLRSLRRDGAAGGSVGLGSQGKYLTTVIPYQPERGPLPVATLQVLVKILKSINEDSPAVPALLTDYILKVLCPS